MEPRIPIPHEQIAAFCEKWQIGEFSHFGSVLTEDFRADSDVDVLVTFAKDAPWRMSHRFEMEDELRVIFGRDIDLVSRPDVERMENYIRRRAILSGAARVYAH
jgi:predicted nucleotidyltransferase